MKGLTHLVYVSRRRPDLSTREIIDSIVIPSLRRNRELDITGCLWFGAEHFLQVLEGTPGEVDRLFERIERDPRHYDIRLVARESIEERRFVRFALKHIASEELSEVNNLVARFTSKPMRDRIAAGERGEAKDDPSFVQAVIGRLRSIVC